MNICVHSMGKVRENSIIDAIETAGLDVLQTHALRHNFAYIKKLQNSKPNAQHLKDSLKIKSLLKQKQDVFFVVVLADPVSRNLLHFFQNSKNLLPKIDLGKSDVKVLRHTLIENIKVNTPQDWMDKEVLDFLGVDLDSLIDFEGDTLLGTTKYGPVLFVKSELSAAKKSAALSKYLKKPIKVRNIREKNSRRVSQLYSKIKAIGLPSEYVIETLDQPYVKLFFSSSELKKIKKAWLNKSSDGKSWKYKSFSTKKYSWVCVHHMGNVGAEDILSELDEKLEATVLETRSLYNGPEPLEALKDKNAKFRHANDGLELFKRLEKKSHGKFIVAVSNPIIRNLATFILNNRKTLSEKGLDDIKALNSEFTDTTPAKSAQIWFSRELLGFFDVHYNDLIKIDPGILYFKSKKGEVLIVGSEVSDINISNTLTNYLGQVIRIDRSKKVTPVKLFNENNEKFFIESRSEGISPDYVKEALSQRYLKEIYDKDQIFKMRLDWEDSTLVRRIKKEIPVENFGRELTTWKDQLESDERIYEAEGGFHLYGARTNIAAANYWAIDASHPKDLREHEQHEEIRLKNFDFWKDDKVDEIEKVRFSPNVDVAIHDISVEVNGIPINNYPFLLGDGCLYYRPAEIEGRTDRYLPGPSEAHCTAISLRESSNFLRSLELPPELPLFLSKYETLNAPQHFARHKPHEIKKTDLDTARVRARIKYRPLKKGMTVHKFIRIPYLDQYPFAPIMVQENRPWYKAWDRNEPLQVKGFTVYFSPKSPIKQQLERIKLFVLDKTGTPVPGKEISMVDQDAGGDTESFSLKPGFVRGDLTVEHGESLSASAYLVEGTPAADLAFYILVEIPASRLDTAFGSPLFFSQGCANLDYLKNVYDEDRKNFISTPAALAVLRSLAQTPLEPWATQVGNFPSDKKDAESFYSKATQYLFVN